LTRITRSNVPRLLLALTLLGGASAAHATQCSLGYGSSLDSEFSTSGDGCSVNPPNDEQQGGYGNEGGDGNYHPPGWTPPPDNWHPPHDNWHQPHDGKDCNPSVVPLPASSWLLLSGALALLALGRRRRAETA
jgi:hypothetical protein